MKVNLHRKTLIAILRDHVNAWRRDNNWSRETVAQVIIEMHEQIGASTGIIFEPHTKDIGAIREVNSQRHFRWLDDETKSTNLLPANYIPSILAAMPIERRLACSSEIMVSIGLGACMTTEGEEGEININTVYEGHKHDLEAQMATTEALQNPTSENLEAAIHKISRAQKFKEGMLKKLAWAMKAKAGAKAVFNRVIHPKKVEA